MNEVENTERVARVLGEFPFFQLDEPSTVSDGYALGDRVRLLKDIWEDETDGLVPAHYLAKKGEVLIVKCGLRKASNLPATIGIAHENRADTNFFNVTLDEIERA